MPLLSTLGTGSAKGFGHRKPVRRINKDLILHLDPANASCFKSGDTTATNLVTGNSVTGASGNPGTGTHTPNTANFPAYSSSNGGVFDFAGGRGMNVEEDLGSNTSMTIDMWVYKNSANTQYFTDARKPYRPDGGVWYLSNYDSENINWNNNTGYNFSGTYNASDTDFLNQWLHIVTTGTTGGTGKIYVNGDEVTPYVYQNTLASCKFGRNFRIGTRFTTSEQWTGLMGPIKPYSVELSAGQVRRNFEADRMRFAV